MVDLLDFFSISRYSGDDDYFAVYRIGNIKSGIYVNLKDFYDWLKINNNEYFNVLRSRHFFFKDSVILEDFSSDKIDRKTFASNVLNQYFNCCYNNNGLGDLSKKIDVQTLSPLFVSIYNTYVFSRLHEPVVSFWNDKLVKDFGYNWAQSALNEDRLLAKKLNVGRDHFVFSDDGANNFIIGSGFRTLFYDSGSSHEIQFDRQQGRENKK